MILLSDVESITRLTAACLVFVAPFVVFGLVAGCVAGRCIKDPWAAGVASGLVGLISFWGSAVASGLVGLISFWGSLVLAIVPLGGEGRGGGPGAAAAILTALFYVVLCITLVFPALSFLTYRNRRAKLRRAPGP
jgi:sugar phosphate permease